jgi:hypothetical protein
VWTEKLIVFIKQFSQVVHRQGAFSCLKYKNCEINEFLKLSGSRDDERSAVEIIEDIDNSRVNSSRFEASNGLFD